MTAESKTCVAPVNIAVIKYWGKRDTSLILPTNSSLSVTLDTNDLHSRTTVQVSPDFDCDRFWLNGKEEPITSRIAMVLSELRSLRKQKETATGMSQWKLHIASLNNFPTAAGLASSASGLACLVVTVARAYKLIDDNSSPEEWQKISMVARMGSGSACRSVFGGFVKWQSGELSNGSDSFAVQVAPRSHWPHMRALILVANDAKKAVSSTSGMQTTVETSSLFQHRIRHVVQQRVVDMERAIAAKDFETFAVLTMKDSNQFHATCMDTYPPIFYMNDTSQQIVHFVHALNSKAGRSVCAYTFDAGPNAVLYFLESDAPLVINTLSRLFEECPLCDDEYVRDCIAQAKNADTKLKIFAPGTIKRVIYTKVGNGPVEVEESLLDKNGMPI